VRCCGQLTKRRQNQAASLVAPSFWSNLPPLQHSLQEERNMTMSNRVLAKMVALGKLIP